MSVEVRAVTTDREMQAFFEFPWTLYKDDPHWVPPLLSIRHELLDKQKSPAWSYMDGEFMLAWRDGRPVGTIVPLINHRHNEFHAERVGWFGMFETYDDPEVASALLHAAEAWVKDKGYPLIRGPQNFTTHEETGLLVEGFQRPVILMPYNPPYYQALIEANGYQKAMDIISVHLTRTRYHELTADGHFDKLVQRTMQRSGITMRPMNMRRKKEEFRLFRDLYNRAWDKNWGFVPFTDAELDALIASLGMFVEAEMAYFVLVHGEPAGFAITVPDFNEVLHKVRPRPGVPELWTMLRAGIQWKLTKTIGTVRMPLLGVVEEHRNKGCELAIVYTMIRSIPKRYEVMDAGWVLEINPLLKMMPKIGGQFYKRHRWYEKSLG